MFKTPVLQVPGALFVLIAALATANAATVPPPVAVSGSLTLSGPGIGGDSKSCSLHFMNNYAGKGDWYVTPNDAHAAFFAADRSPYSQCVVDLLLNGTGKTFLINSANDLAAGHKSDLAFDVTMGDGHSNKKFSTVDPGDAVTINVTKMDMLSFEASFSGNMTEVGMMERNGHEAHEVTVSGTVSLHRQTAPAPVSAGNWHDCDPIIHDWLNEAEDRAASECETKFDHHLQETFIAAFEPFENAMQASQWQFVNKPDPNVLFLAAIRGSEKAPFQGPGLKLTMNIDPNSAQGRQAQVANTSDPRLVHAMDLLKEGKYAEAQELEKQINASQQSALHPPSTRISVQVLLNRSSSEFINFHGNFTSTPLAGGGTVVYLPEMQSLGGGSSGDPGTWVLLGPWSQPMATHLDDDSTKVTAKAQFNPSAPRLSIQSISVYINADQALANKAIQAIDWSKLRALLTEK